jgi:hypothetical protein
MHYTKANPAEPINANHINMIKFKGSEDGDYRNVQQQLARLETRLSLTLSNQGS